MPFDRAKSFAWFCIPINDPLNNVITNLSLFILHCKSKKVIYLITCNRCNVQYVGSATNEFKVRFRNHKSAMSTKKNTCEVAIHFNKETHVLSDFGFVIIEQICNFSDHNSLDNRLLTREAFWSAQLCSLQPHGSNKRSEFNSMGIELDTINTLFLSPASVLPFDLMTKVFSFFLDISLNQSFKGSIRDFVTRLRVDHTMLEFRGL